jgi:hypothetical protein
MASNGKIVNSDTITFGGPRKSQFDVMIPYVNKLRPGKAVQATSAVEDPARLKSLQSQLCVWVRKRRATGALSGAYPIKVRQDKKGQLWLAVKE